LADARIPAPPGFRLCAGEDTGRPHGDAALLPGSGHGPFAVEALYRQPARLNRWTAAMTGNIPRPTFSQVSLSQRKRFKICTFRYMLQCSILCLRP
jgi:hypothetical protein